MPPFSQDLSENGRLARVWARQTYCCAVCVCVCEREREREAQHHKGILRLFYYSTFYFSRQILRCHMCVCACLCVCVCVCVRERERGRERERERDGKRKCVCASVYFECPTFHMAGILLRRTCACEWERERTREEHHIKGAWPAKYCGTTCVCVCVFRTSAAHLCV